MKRASRLLAVAAVLALLWPAVSARASEPHVLVATLDGVINPITDHYIVSAVDRAVQSHATALIIAMDTPGGLEDEVQIVFDQGAVGGIAGRTPGREEAPLILT